MARVETKPPPKENLKHSPVAVMEELIQYFGETSLVLDKSATGTDSTYTSLIKFHGVPILPPLLTEEKREEMRAYRHQALIAETRLKARQHEKLLSTVQNIVNNIEARKTPTTSPREVTIDSMCSSPDIHGDEQKNNNRRSDVNSTSSPPNLTTIDSSATLSHCVTDCNLPEENINTSHQQPVMYSDLVSPPLIFRNTLPSLANGKNYSDSSQSKGNSLNNESPVFYFSGLRTNELVSKSKESVQSNSSVSTDSELNRTVITRDTDGNEDSSVDNPDTHTLSSNTYSPYVVEVQSGSDHTNDDNYVQCDNKSLTNVGNDSNVLRNSSMDGKNIDMSAAPSIGDSDVHSLLGEYQPLPPPVASASPDVSHISYISDGNNDLQSLNPAHYIQGLQRPLMMKSSDMFVRSTETVPTLTSSYNLSQYMHASGDTIVSSSLIQDEVADTPVMTNSSKGNGKLSDGQLPPTSKSSNESGDHVMSPPKLTRQGSYTLDKPSPALMESELRNDINSSGAKSAQRKLDYGESLHNRSQMNNLKQRPKSPSTDSEAEGKEEHLHRYLEQISQVPILNSLPSWGDIPSEDVLKAQATHFAELRQKLIAQQREQLSTLLAEQEQEQTLLQQEMIELQRQRGPSRQIMQGSNLTSTNNALEMKHISYGNIQERRQTSSEFGSTYSQFGEVNGIEKLRPKQGRRDGSSGRSTDSNHKPYLEYEETAMSKLYSSQPHDVSGVVLHAPSHPRYSVTARIRNIEQNITPDMHRHLCRVSATAKGYLTRRLLKTEKVQEQIKVIKDTAEFAINFQSETPIKKGVYSMSDISLQERVIAQLRAALLEIHEIFFGLSTSEKMAMIAQSRQMMREKELKLMEHSHNGSKVDHQVSAATKKAMNRRQKALAAEAAVFGGMIHRPKTAPPHTSSPKKKRFDDVGGPVRRHYQSIIAKAVKPMHSNISPIKPHADKNSYKDRSPRTQRPKTAPPEATTRGRKPVVGKTARRSLYSGATAAKSRVATTTKPGWK